MINFKLLLNLIHCQFTHAKNLPKVYLPHLHKEGSYILEPMDMLLFHGHSLLHKSIQSCTDSKYNHVAIYVGGKAITYADASKYYFHYIAHAIGKGLVRQTIQEAWSDSDKFIDVYRYKGGLTFADRDKMNDTINRYLENKERYAVEALLTLAFISLLRKDAGFLQRKLIDETFQGINDAFEAGKEPLDCSEFEYRVCDESGKPIRILPESLHDELINSDNPIIKEFLKRKENLYRISPDFATPHDLAMSPDLVFVGQLQKEF
ncbi:MAG: hypothetical protein IMZ53_00445 [Thermoplasmata archaeon]|nr:hypothetical protein [Thermoplasmata archaeon]